MSELTPQTAAPPQTVDEWLDTLPLQLLRGEARWPDISGTAPQVTLRVARLISARDPGTQAQLRRCLAQWTGSQRQSLRDPVTGALLSGLSGAACLRRTGTPGPGPLAVSPEDHHVSGLITALVTAGETWEAPEITSLMDRHRDSPVAAEAVDTGLITGLSLGTPEQAARFWALRKSTGVSASEHGDWKRLRDAEQADWPATLPVTPLLSPAHTNPDIWESLLRSGALAPRLVGESWNAPVHQLRAAARPAPVFKAQPHSSLRPLAALHELAEDEPLDHDFRLIVGWLLTLRPGQRREALNDLTLSLVHSRHPLRQMSRALSDDGDFSVGVATELGLWLIRAGIALARQPTGTVENPRLQDEPLEHLPAEHAPEWLLMQMLGRVERRVAPDPLPEEQSGQNLAACLWLRDVSQGQFAVLSAHFGVDLDPERPDEATRRTDQLAHVFWLGATLNRD